MGLDWHGGARGGFRLTWRRDRIKSNCVLAGLLSWLGCNNNGAFCWGERMAWFTNL